MAMMACEKFDYLILNSKTYLLFVLKRLLVYCIGLVFTCFSYGQDIHFSQFYSSPQTLNPANTGDFPGSWRMNHLYRSQWNAISPYNTIALSGDRQFSLQDKTWSGGLILLHDRSNNGLLQTTQLHISTAYRFYSNAHQFNIGVQPGVVNRHLGNGLSFGDQFDEGTGTFNALMSTEDLAYKDDVFAFDLNAGLKYTFNHDVFEPSLGFAVFHLYSSQQSQITSGNYQAPMRMVAHADFHINMSQRVYLTPNYLYMSQNEAEEMVYGLTATYIMDDSYLEKSVFAGAYTRNEFENFDALIFLAGANWLNWTVALSYDLNMSALGGLSNNPGGFEISLIYREFTSQLQKILIPCERF